MGGTPSSSPVVWNCSRSASLTGPSMITATYWPSPMIPRSWSAVMSKLRASLSGVRHDALVAHLATRVAWRHALDRAEVRTRVEPGDGLDDVTEHTRDTCRVASRRVVSAAGHADRAGRRGSPRTCSSTSAAVPPRGSWCAAGTSRPRRDHSHVSPRADAGNAVVGDTEAAAELLRGRVAVVARRLRVVDARRGTRPARPGGTARRGRTRRVRRRESAPSARGTWPRTGRRAQRSPE